MKSVSDPMPINAGITGLTFQIGCIVLVETARRVFGLSKQSKTHAGEEKDVAEETGTLLRFPCRPKWDVPKLTRFGENALSPQLMWKSMKGTNEPLANPWWAFLMFFVISMLTPIAPEYQPPLDPETASFYSFSPPAVVNGIPWWAFKIIVGSILPFSILMIAIYNMPDVFAVDAKKIEEEGIDPDLVELTLQEKNRRTSYDERNMLVYRRRSTISKAMEDIQLAAAQAQVEEDAKVTENRRRMSALVMAMPLEEETLKEISEEA